MPYIKVQRRKELEGIPFPKCAGELNYLITLLLVRYTTTKDKSYQTFNDVIGALEAAKLEYVRRLVDDYEDSKIVENTDVYPDQLI